MSVLKRAVAGITALALLALAVLSWPSTPARAQTVIATIPVGSSPHGVGVNPTTNRIYVANFNRNTVSVLDGLSNTADAGNGWGR